MPRVVVLAGINGAGKTTASRDLLVSVLKIPVFTNADAIARGLNSLNPESEAARAARVMLGWLRELADKKRDFAFETTLAARTYAPWLGELRQFTLSENTGTPPVLFCSNVTGFEMPLV